MAVSVERNFRLQVTESIAGDLGTGIQHHVISPAAATYATGTGDSQFDLVWSDTRTLVATTETLDLAGSLTAAIGGATITMVEIGIICIRNKATAASSQLRVSA